MMKSEGLITGPEEAFDILIPLGALRVKSWDNSTSIKTVTKCVSALKAAGYYFEAPYSHRDGAKMIYRFYVYRNQAERRVCFASHS